METYSPILFQLPIIKHDLSYITNLDSNEIFSIHNPIPLVKLGFNNYIYRLKNETIHSHGFSKIDIGIVNRLDVSIKNFENSISDIANFFFEIETGSVHPILSRAFYKLWEIILSFCLINNDEPIISAHLADAPGAFMQAVIYYRQKLASRIAKKDKYYFISILTEQHNELVKHHFVNNYEKQIFMHHTNKHDIGDLLNRSTRDNFIAQFEKNKVNLITADGGFEWNDENKQEQEALPLIIAEILTAIQIQSKNGHFVCKVYETFTHITIKLLYILRACYEQIFLFKPMTSHDTNSEKYMVCYKFKYDYDDEFILKIVKTLNDILEKYEKKKELFIFDFYPKLLIEDSFMTVIKHANKDATSIKKIIKLLIDANQLKIENLKNQ